GGAESYVSQVDLIQTVAWSPDRAGVRILDQRQLPLREVYRELRSVDDVCDAIRTLAVRGAPAIGIAGAMGLTLAIDDREADSDTPTRIVAAAKQIRATRPTAINLACALDRMLAVAADHRGKSLREELRAEATRILDEDRVM